MKHGPEFTAVFVACLVLAAGAAMRQLSRWTRLPYTIAMLLLGLGVGFVIHRWGSHAALGGSLDMLGQGAFIHPDLIIFVFLPALVFESAFVLDQYAFAKEIGAFGLLALPALIVSTALVGVAMFAMTSGTWDWGWPAALVFGALISATDPVAVVAILREVGAPKRLGILVEGESLLNDGTSIVVFTVLLGLLTTAGASFQLGPALLSFVKVVLGGVVVGVVLAAAVSLWASRMFNDPLVEITLTLAVAYLAMLIAEGFFHVSGVLAVVVSGYWLGGRGRTSISPEVMHFLHHFWEMLSHIANTLIFFLVGLVIAAQVKEASFTDLGLVLGTYVLVMLVRFVVTYAFRPVLILAGSPVSSREAAVLSWGGLRGAVSLALALVVSRHPEVDPEIGRQILLATAGVVFLTVFVNGATVSVLLDKLGFQERSASEQLAVLAANASAMSGVKERVDLLAQSRDLRALDWQEVEVDLARRHETILGEIRETEGRLCGVDSDQRAEGYWRQALGMEREAYWDAFSEGTLGAKAVKLLDLEIDRHMDRIESGDQDPPASRLTRQHRAGSTLWRKVRGQIGRLQFSELSLLYDMARGETLAADRVIQGLGDVDATGPALESVIEAYRGYLRSGKEEIEGMRVNLPELTGAIEARLVMRIQLNIERDEYKSLEKRGLLEAGDAALALASVEDRMARLRRTPMSVTPPETAELCRHSPIFASLDEATLADVAELTKERVLSPGEVLFKEGDKGHVAYVIARGAMHVLKQINGKERFLDVLGGGDVVGEMAVLTGGRRTATIRAATAVTVGAIEQSALAALMDHNPGLRDHVWHAYATHRFDNYLRPQSRFRHLDHGDRVHWIGQSRQVVVPDGQTLDVGDGEFAFVFVGALVEGETRHAAPCLVDIDPNTAAMVGDGMTRVALLPHFYETQARSS